MGYNLRILRPASFLIQCISYLENWNQHFLAVGVCTEKLLGRNCNSENTTHYYSLTKGLLSLKKKKKEKLKKSQQKPPSKTIPSWFYRLLLLASLQFSKTDIFDFLATHRPSAILSLPTLFNKPQNREVHKATLGTVSDSSVLLATKGCIQLPPQCVLLLAPHVSRPGEGRLFACWIPPTPTVHRPQAQAQLCSPAQPSPVAGSASPGLMSAWTLPPISHPSGWAT